MATQMLADISKISYLKEGNDYHIIVEWSDMPVETFNNEFEAWGFINGYSTGSARTPTEEKGRLLRLYVENDIMNGIEYVKKRNDIENIEYKQYKIQLMVVK